MNGISAPSKKSHRVPQPLPTGHNDKIAVCEPGSELLPDTRSALILEFQPPEL